MNYGDFKRYDDSKKRRGRACPRADLRKEIRRRNNRRRYGKHG